MCQSWQSDCCNVITCMGAVHRSSTLVIALYVSSHPGWIAARAAYCPLETNTKDIRNLWSPRCFPLIKTMPIFNHQNDLLFSGVGCVDFGGFCPPSYPGSSLTFFPRYPDLELSKFLSHFSPISRDAAGVPDKLSDPKRSLPPEHPAIKNITRSPCCDKLPLGLDDHSLFGASSVGRRAL